MIKADEVYAEVTRQNACDSQEAARKAITVSLGEQSAHLMISAMQPKGRRSFQTQTSKSR